MCKEFAGKDNICVCLGDNIFEDNFSDLKLNYFDSWCHLFFKKVPDPERFGVPVFHGVGKHLLKLEEKPENPKSDYAVTGLYVFNQEVWNIINTLKPSERGELEITDLLKKYQSRNQLKAEYIGRGGAWLDTGSIEDFYKTSLFVSTIENRQGFKIACIEEIAYSNKWINKNHIKKSIKFYGNCEYSSYLKKIIS